MAISDKPDERPDVKKVAENDSAEVLEGSSENVEETVGAGTDESAQGEVGGADTSHEPEGPAENSDEPMEPYLATERVDIEEDEPSGAGAAASEKASDDVSEDATDGDEVADTGKDGDVAGPSVTTAELLAVGAAAGAAAHVVGADTNEEEDTKPEEKSASETKSQGERTQPASAPAERRSGVMPMLLGGALVAVLGFFAGRGEVLDPYLPESMRGQSVDLAPMESQLASQSAALATAQEELAATQASLAAALDEIAASQAELDATRTALEQQVSDLTGLVEASAGGTVDLPEGLGELPQMSDMLADLAARLEALEARPVVEAPDTENLATSDQVADLQEALEAQKSELAALGERARLAEENATAEAQKVLARAALMRVNTAVSDGAAFAPELSALEEVVAVEVPPALRAAASDGVASLGQLQEDFAPAARAALAAARSEVPESDVQGIGGFIKRQLSVRSVVPREGDDPDAVLSRAEAAVRGGAVGEALSELEALPAAARAAMQDWIDRASERQAAQDAAAALSDSLTSN